MVLSLLLVRSDSIMGEGTLAWALGSPSADVWGFPGVDADGGLLVSIPEMDNSFY